MTNITENETKNYIKNNKRKYVVQIAKQVEMAFESKKTPKKVKACLYSVILEASINADMTLGDFSLVRKALPRIFDALGDEYGNGVIHSIDAILHYDTDSLEEYFKQGFDRKDDASPLYKEIVAADTETLAVVLSAMMHNDNLPTELYNIIGDSINQIKDVHSPETVLYNLQKMNAEVSK